jgi:hypothetical protein
MAFSIGGNDGQTGSRPRAVAFLNLWVRRKDGTRAKIGAIPLAAEGYQGTVAKRLEQDDGLEALVNNLEIDYVKVDPNRSYDPGF